MTVQLHNDFSDVYNNIVYLDDNYTNSNNLRLLAHGIWTFLHLNPDYLQDLDDVHIIFTNLFNSPTRSKYYNLPNNHIQPNLASFHDAKGIRVVVDMTFTYFDPQIFNKNMPDSVLYKKETLDRFRDEPCFNQGSNSFDSALMSYSNKILIHEGRIKEMLDSIYLSANSLLADIIIVPVLCFSHYKHSGLLNDERFNFIHYDHLVPYCITEDAITLPTREIDVFLSGTALSFIYPYRNLVRSKILPSLGTKMKTLDDYPDYISNYIIPRSKRFQDRLLLNDPYQLQDLNDELRTMDNIRYDKYLEKIRDSKVSICCSSIYGYPLKKFLESMSMGAVVVGDLPKFPDECGIVHGFNAIQCDLNELDSVIHDLMEKPDYLHQLALNAQKLIESRYTPLANARLFFNSLKNILEKGKCKNLNTRGGE